MVCVGEVLGVNQHMWWPGNTGLKNTEDYFRFSKYVLCQGLETKYQQAQLGVPHSEIQVEQE